MAMRSSARSRLAQHGPNPSAIPDDILARVQRAGQSTETFPPQVSSDNQYAFLVGTVIGGATLAIAEAEAHRCEVAPHEVLLSTGALPQTAYTSALAHRLGVPVANWDAAFDLKTHEDGDDVKGLGLAAHIGGRPCRVLCAEDGTPDALRQRINALQARGLNVALASKQRMDAVLEVHWKAERIDRAVRGLFRQQPMRSAAGPVWTWQVILAAVAVGLIVGGFSVLPDATIAALTGIIALPFLCVTMLRIVALREVMTSSRNRIRQQRLDIPSFPERTLPVYSVLVPLFREAKVLPGLVQSLQALAYPKAKLDILLVLEAVDVETQAAVLAARLPGNFRTIVVPDQTPRTKPKALNYALQFARGEYVVVYDAEDRPEPDQLLRALATFRANPPRLGCVQAQLNIYNPRASWVTRDLMAQTPVVVGLQ